MIAHTKKKVLYLITKSNWGGAQRYVYDLATNLDTHEFEPVVAMGGDGVLREMLHNAGIRTITLSAMQNKASIKQARLAAAELYTVFTTERPDILHVNSSVAGLLGTIVGHTARVSYIIFTAHGWAFNEDRPLWQRLAIKTLHYLTVLLSDRTIAVSRAIVTQMNWPGATRKMKVINPGRSIGVMYERTDAREKIMSFVPSLLPYQHDTWIVTLAELHPIKRHIVIIQSISQLVKKYPTLRLILIGEGSQKQQLETEIKNNNLTKHVFLTGNIVEAARFLKAFDLFVLASKSESYGYVLAEAGIAGIPIIATDVGGIPDIITDKETGLLVPPDSVPALTEAITTLLQEPTLSKQYVEKLTNTLAKRTVQKMTRATEDLYTHQ